MKVYVLVGEINWGGATPTCRARGVRAFCNDVLKYNLLAQTESQTRRNQSAIPVVPETPFYDLAAFTHISCDQTFRDDPW